MTEILFLTTADVDEVAAEVNSLVDRVEILEAKTWVATSDFTGDTDVEQIQAAVDSGAETVWIVPGEYDMGDDPLVLPSTLKRLWAIPGSVTFTNCIVNISGSVGTEIPLTSAAVQGDSTLALDSSTLSALDYVKTYAAINALSSDAGNNRIGVPTVGDDGAFFGEFQKIREVPDGVSVTLSGNLLFPHSDTPGADSGARTGAGAVPVTFTEGLVVSGINFVHTAGISGVFIFEWCKDCWVEHCKFNYVESDPTATGQIGEMYDCLGGGFRFCDIVRAPYDSGVMSGSSWNSFKTFGCQDTGIAHCTIDGGGQCVDFTWENYESISVNCYADYNIMRNCGEGATNHSGAYGGSMSHNKISNANNGIRVRSKDCKVIGNEIIKGSVAGGFGINVGNGYTEGTIIANNIIRGHLIGIQVEDAVDAPYPGRLIIEGNQITESSDGIGISRDDESAQSMGIMIRGNTIRKFSSQGIFIGSYCNGIIIEGNTFIDPTSSARAGIEYLSDVVNLVIGRNYFIDFGTEFVLRGDNVATQITDTTTFPGGDADAHIFIDEQIRIGAHGGDSGLPTSDSQITVVDTSKRHNVFEVTGISMERDTGDTYTIASGVITVNRPGIISLAGEGGAADDLVTVSGASAGWICIFKANAAADITIKNGSGNIICGSDFVLTTESDRFIAIYDGTNWQQLSRADNS